ncbi:MAG: hypothetical protein ACREH3_02425 [Geminicoccales bacterium]
MADRRRFLTLGVAAVVIGAGGRSAQANAGADFYGEGCSLLQARQGNRPPEERTLDSSGDEVLDRALGRALVHISQEFDVYPGFSFYDDEGAPNARATPFTLLDDGIGTVLFGINLLHTQLDAHPDGDIAVLGICAHEFGHIVQFFSPYHRQLRKAHATAKLVELHADFLAGHFVARRREHFPNMRLQGLGEAWEAMGDVKYNDPQHHGTSAERLAAIEQGYFWGRDSSGDVRDAAESGARYVKETFA